MFPELSLIASQSSHSLLSPRMQESVLTFSLKARLWLRLRSDLTQRAAPGVGSGVFIVTQFIALLLISGDIDYITQLNMHGLSCVSITKHLNLISDDQNLTRFPPAKYLLTIYRDLVHTMAPEYTRHETRGPGVACQVLRRSAPGPGNGAGNRNKH